MYADRMTRILLLPLASIVALGCTETAIQQSAAVPAVPQTPPVIVVYEAQNAKSGASDADASGLKREYTRRDVGDFIVYRFTGTMQKPPATLTKRVVGRKGDVIEVDVFLEQGQSKQAFRVSLTDATTNRDEILSAARIDGDQLTLISVSEFKSLLSKTFIPADDNEEEVQTEQITATIAHDSVPAERTTYRVRLGKKSALMRSTTSRDFCWGDIEGDIVTGDGEVLYRAEIIHIGHKDIQNAERTPHVAQSNYDQFE
jgi:hypothetical protein